MKSLSQAVGLTDLAALASQATSVPMPATWEGAPGNPDAHPAAVAFKALFPDAKSPDKELPEPGHDIFVLDIDRPSGFVHNATFDELGKIFLSGTAWFELHEIHAWEYAPNPEQEHYRRFSLDFRRRLKSVITPCPSPEESLLDKLQARQKYIDELRARKITVPSIPFTQWLAALGFTTADVEVMFGEVNADLSSIKDYGENPPVTPNPYMPTEPKHD